MNTPDRMWHGDEWEIAGNFHLLRHIRTVLAANSKHYGNPATQLNPIFVANVRRMVAAKKAWASEMSDIAVNGEVEGTTQKACWADLIGKAEASLER